MKPGFEREGGRGNGSFTVAEALKPRGFKERVAPRTSDVQFPGVPAQINFESIAMAVKITYFVHGTTTDNEKDVSSGWSDVELSELGKKQSIDLWDYVKDKRFDVVFCSDLKRSVDSAKLAFEGQVPIIQDARLRECNYGIYNAQPSVLVEPMQEKNTTTKFPEGESYEDVKVRIADFLEFLKQNYDGKSVAIVAHKAPQLAFDVLLKNKTWEEAFAEDWRKTKSWKPGWDYVL